MIENIKIKKNDIIEVQVTSLTPEAVSIAEYKGYTIHFNNALIGEKVRIKILKVIKNFAFAKLISVIKSSNNRVDVIDEKGYQTGIIPLQHMTYKAQLDFKYNVVRNYLLEKNLEVEIYKTIGHNSLKDNNTDNKNLKTNNFKYRNKAQVPVRRVEGLLQTGMFKKNTHVLIPLKDFFIQDCYIDDVILKIRNIMRDFKIVPYLEESHEGNLRNIIVRRSIVTKQIMIVLVTRKAKLFQAHKIVDRILKEIPNVVSIIQNINSKKSNTLMGENNNILYGNDWYEDEIMGYKFKISSKSFYQINSLQVETLYAEVLKAINYDSNSLRKCVLDAYCGIGTISLALSSVFEKVYGVEIIQDAVQMAQENAKINGIENVDFICGAVEQIIPDLIKELKSKDFNLEVIVVDPPRKGLEKVFIDTVLKVMPEKMVYVSCNPKTLARDLALLVEGGYKIEYVQPVDMFPMTTHVECIALLVKR